MPKVIISPISSTLSNTAANQINENLNRIAEAIEDQVSRSGEAPNQMELDFDLNHNDLLNVKSVFADDVSVNGTSILEAIEEIQVAQEAVLEVADQVAEDAQIASDAAAQAQALVDGFTADLNGKQDLDEKGQANGYAPLGADGKVPSAYISDQGSYLGTWDASTNTPTITAGVGSNGDFYQVSVAGNQSITGFPEDFFVGDTVRFTDNGSMWERVPSNQSVLDVAGKTGNVTLVKADVGLGNVDNTSDANKPISSAQATALANRLRVDTAAQGLTGTEQSNARTNLALGSASIADTGTLGHTVPFLDSTSNVWSGAQTFSTNGAIILAASQPSIRATDTDTGVDSSISWNSSNGFTSINIDTNSEAVAPGLDINIQGVNRARLVSNTLRLGTDTSLSFQGTGASTTKINLGLIDSVTPEQFGAVGDGVTNDGAAMIAWAAEVATGKAGILTGGKNYLLGGSTLTFTNQDVVIIGNGAVITQNSNSRHFNITNDFTQINNLSGTSLLNYTFFEASATTPVTRVNFSTPANLSNFSVGDIVKVVSDAVVPDEETDHREGEFAQVGAIDGSGLILTHRLLFPVSGNPRVAKLNTTNKVQISDLTMDHIGYNDTTTWTNNRMSINNVYQPTLSNVKSLHSASQGIQLASCYQAGTVNLAVSNARTYTGGANDSFGYGLYETSCAYSVHINPRFTNCRHGFTTVMIGTTAGDNNISRRGRNFCATIVNGVAHGCTAAGFDTHADAYKTKFIGCTVDGARQGIDSGTRNNYQIRGFGESFINCTSIGSARGFLINQISPSNPQQADAAQIINCEHQGTSVDTSDEAAVVVRSSAGTVVLCKIDNFRFYRNGSTAPLLDADAAEVFLTNPHCVGPNSTSGACRDYIANQDSIIRIRGGMTDSTGSHASATFSPFRGAEAGTLWDVDGYTLVTDNGKLTSIVSAVDASGGREIQGRFRNISTNRTPGALTTVGTQLTNAVFIDAVGAGSLNFNSSYNTQTYGSSGDKTLSLSRSGGNTVYWNITTSTSGVIITTINDGAFTGQELVIRNASGSSNNLVVETGSISLGGDVTLTPGDSLRLYWQGTSWMRA